MKWLNDLIRKTYPTESHLCEAWVAAAPEDWVFHPECGGWDLLVETPWGQLGIQAKLKANLSVLEQAIRHRFHGTGPAFHSVLVPRSSGDFDAVARALKVIVFNPDPNYGGDGLIFKAFGYHCLIDARRWHHDDEHKIPPVQSHQKAGVPSPSPLTPWRVKALKLCALLRQRAYVTSRDFKDAGVSMTTWTRDERWLRPAGKEGRLTKYAGIYTAPDFPDRGWEAEQKALMEVSDGRF